MKKTILYMVFALVFLNSIVFPATAQSNVSYKGEIVVRPIRLEQLGESIYVEMDFDMTDVKVQTAASVELIPRLVSPTDTLELPRVSLKGRNEYLAYERMLSLLGTARRGDYPEPYRVERSTKQATWTIPYRYTLPYESWMADARLEVQRDECGCGELAWMTTDPVIDRVAHDIPYVVVPHLAFVQPVPEPIKNREKQVEAFLDFEVNKTVIRPEYMNNPGELAKIRAMIDELQNDATITINRLDIIGYASPEGTLEGNKRLSEGRAMALRNYLAGRYAFPPSIYQVVFGGENWEGLRKALATLDMAHKDEVENVVNYYEGQDRKNRLKQLAGGQPYRYLLSTVYPGLRVAICRVEYNIRNFDVDEAKEVIKSRPQNLSLNEMYLVANTYPSGSQEFIDVFETAVRMFPEDDTANLNAAVSSLMRGDAVAGERYLNRVKSSGLAEYQNAAGVLALLKGDYESAEKHLKAAASAGLETAGKNLEELEKKRANDLRIKPGIKK